MLGSALINDWTRRAMCLAILWLAGCLAIAQTVPPAVVSQTAILTTSGLTKPGKVVQDTCGNLYELEAGGNLLEIPAGGGNAIYLANNGGQAADGLYGGLAIDRSNNLYVDSKWNGKLVKIPSNGCTPNPSGASDFLNAGSSLGNVFGFYWSDPGDIAVDGSGTVFVATNNCCTNNKIVAETAAGTALLILDSNSLPQVTSIAADMTGDIFFTVKGFGNVYEIPVAKYGTATPNVIASGLISALGVSFDAAGNLFVGDIGDSAGAGSIYEIPYDSSTHALAPGKMFLLATSLSLGNAPAPSTGGNSVFYTDGSSATVFQQVLGAANLGSAKVGIAATASVNVAFNAALTPSSIGFAGTNGIFSSASGGTCQAEKAYTAGESCTVAVSFTPAAPGLAKGALVLADSTGADLASGNLSGIGLGAGLTADPGTVASVGTGYQTPMSIARDTAGNVFVADSGTSSVWEIPAAGTDPIQIGNHLNSPRGVAVDAAGNLYIADTGSNRIVELPVVNGAVSTAAEREVVSSTTSIAGAVLNGPAGLSSDAQGNLYIADTGNDRIVYLPYNGTWAAAAAFTLGSAWNAPLATTVSAAGVIYVADGGSGKIYSLPYPATAVGATIVATGFDHPSALATDAAGDLFVVDSGHSQVLRIPNISGSLSTTSRVNVGFGVANPYGVAIDGVGDLYVSDNVNAAVYTIARTNSAQSFGKWNPSTTSDPLAFSVASAGNQPLIFGNPYSTATGDTTAFASLTAEVNACAGGATLAPGASCNIESTFTAPDLGTFSETLAFSSNASNASSPQVTFTGAGAVTVPTKTAFAITSPSGNPYYGQAITLSASVTADSDTPTGKVALIVDGNQAATASLTAGSATFSLSSGLSGGSHTLQISYKGADSGFVVFSPSSSPVQTIDVTRVSTTSSVSFTTLYVSPMSQPAGTPLNLSTTVISAAAGLPAGAVTFTVTGSDGSKTVQSEPLLPGGGGLFQATLPYTPAAPASGIAYTLMSVSATYEGDGNFTGSKAATQTFYVSPGSGSVSASSSGLSISSSTTSAGSVTFTSTTYGGWTGVVGFSCLQSSLPANARCVFSPGELNLFPSTPGSVYPPSTVTLSITIDNPPQNPTASTLAWWLGGLTGLLLLLSRRRVKHQLWGGLIALVACLAMLIGTSTLTACGSSARYITPKASSTVTVYASADPYLVTSSGVDTSKTQACGDKNPASAPCVQQSFQVSLAVQ